jgi:hypothetical protein
MKKLLTVSFLLLTFLSGFSYGQNGPWGPYPSPRFPSGRPISPYSQAARIAREQAIRAWQEQKRQIEAGWEQDRLVRERYGNALRREQEAQRQAEYAERYFPGSGSGVGDMLESLHGYCHLTMSALREPEHSA